MAKAGAPKQQRSFMTRCECCGEEFYCHNQAMWGYKVVENNRMKLFCSWSCKRAYEGENPKTKGAETRMSFGT